MTKQRVTEETGALQKKYTSRERTKPAHVARRTRAHQMTVSDKRHIAAMEAQKVRITALARSIHDLGPTRFMRNLSASFHYRTQKFALKAAFANIAPEGRRLRRLFGRVRL